MLDHGIEDGQQFTHAGCDGDLLRLACIDEASVELLEDWVEAHGDQGGHVGAGRLPARPSRCGILASCRCPGREGQRQRGQRSLCGSAGQAREAVSGDWSYSRDTSKQDHLDSSDLCILCSTPGLSDPKPRPTILSSPLCSFSPRGLHSPVCSLASLNADEDVVLIPAHPTLELHDSWVVWPPHRCLRNGRSSLEPVGLGKLALGACESRTCLGLRVTGSPSSPRAVTKALS